MLKNYLKVAIRNLIRQKGFSFINIFGLALGISCTTLIALWVTDELSYDRFHASHERMFRITATLPEMKIKAAVTSAPLGPAMKDQLPEIEDMVRISGLNTDLLQVGDNKFDEKRIIYADSNFFKFFDFKFIKGDRESALLKPEGIVITEAMAIRYFGTTDAVDKIIRKNNKDDFSVTAVIENVPSNSHLRFDFVQPLRYLARTNNDLKNNVWDNFNWYTYIRVNDKVASDPGALTRLEQGLQDLYKKNEQGLKVSFILQPLTDIHLHSRFLADIDSHGSAQNVYIFTIVAIFILVVACLNFMNLATARAARRAKEVGLRKTVGAVRPLLMGQFLAESLVVAFLSLTLGILFIWLALPYFNILGGKNLVLDFTNLNLVGGLLAITIITGLLAGSYPAVYLSGFLPATVLKGSFTGGGAGSLFRNTMVVIQFTISIALIVGTLVVYRQLTYIQQLNLGYDKENLVYVPMTGELWSKYDAFRTTLETGKYTSQYSFISSLPTTHSNATVSVSWPGKDPNSQPLFYNISIDNHFEEVFKATILEGRGFSENLKGDSSNIILNQAALKVMSIPLESAVGSRINVWGRERTVVGIVKDFNFKPINEEIGPMFLTPNTWGGYAMIRTAPGSLEGTVNELERICKELNPAYPFHFSFLDQDIANQYTAEKRLGSVFNVFASLAIIISCLGLYGLSAYLAERRTRELGIRKVLGASGGQLVYLLGMTFTRPIVIAMCIAVPLSYHAMDLWLSSFVFRISIDWTVYAIAFFAALLIAGLTVSFESVKAALSNPVKALRSE